MKAMVAIGSLLRPTRLHGAPVPDAEAGRVSDGWDIADAIAQGWTAEEVRAFIRGAHAFVPPDDAAERKARARKPRAAAPHAGSTRSMALTARRQRRDPARARERVLALDGVPTGTSPGRRGRGRDRLQRLHERRREAAPDAVGHAGGRVGRGRRALMGNWLTREHWLPSMPRGTLEEAVAMVAKRHRFHPVRDELEQPARQVGRHEAPAHVAATCCLEERGPDDPAARVPRARRHVARHGDLRARAHAGLQIRLHGDLRGPQGVGKSTLAKLLGGDYFADTGLVLGDKDSYQNLQGVLVYEWGELDSLNRSEVTKVKQFISSAKDRFRASSIAARRTIRVRWSSSARRTKITTSSTRRAIAACGRCA
jgi:putative DNA primase/helicase